MLKKSVLFVLFAAACVAANGQEEKQRKGRPDIPGTFLIDLGFNFPTEKESFNTGIWGSRTLNIYYQYDKQLFNSKFSIHPGIGFGLERYKFNNSRTLGFVNDTISMVPITGASVRKSQLITNYLDVPVELRFSTNPNDPARSFKIAVGFKAGILLDSFTKVKSTVDGNKQKVKDKQDFDLNQFRYGVTFRVGAGNFNLWSYYSLSPLFTNGLGVDQTEIRNFSIGISLTGF